MQAISQHVTVFTSRTAADMTSGVITSRNQALLIDPGVLPDEIAAIEAFVRQQRSTVIAILLTHHHWDHVLGTPPWPEARRIAHSRFAECLASAEATLPMILADVYAAEGVADPPPFALLAVTDYVEDGIHLEIGDLPASLLHLPGHAADALGLLLPTENILFSADMLDSIELPLPNHDIHAYLTSLQRIEGLVEGGQVETVVPGHGPPLQGRERIREQIAVDRRYLEAVRATAQAAIARDEDFDVAWPRFRALSYFDKGDPDRDQEHQENACAVLEQLRFARQGE